MNREELIQRTAFSCVARFAYASDDVEEIKSAFTYFAETWCHEYKPVPPAPNDQEFVAGFERWKAAQK